ncbi:hypothetical protein B0H10DRAFT_1938531 [Mycena sp. CBHHK59/15]|nr:hypothetical protein B0H10DRAFT_1938531 [Mycena sp. CBHHK59/15]
MNLCPDKVTVLDVAKIITLWGDNDSVTGILTHIWSQSSRNFLIPLKCLCPTPNSANPVANFAVKYEKHLEFFSGLEGFEGFYSIWNSVEKELHVKLANQSCYNVQGAINTFKAAKAIAAGTTSFSTKHMANLDSHPGPKKNQKNSNDSGSFCDNGSFRDQHALPCNQDSGRNREQAPRDHDQGPHNNGDR